MKNKLLVFMVLVMAFTAGCQQQGDREITKQDQVALLDMAETNIPEEDNIVEIKEDLFVVEEKDDWSDYWARVNLKLVNKDGGSTLIASNIEEWKVINTNGKDFIYYSDGESLASYDIETSRSVVVYTMQGNEEVEILKDEGANKNYLLIKGEYNEGWPFAVFTLLDLENDQVVFEKGNIGIWPSVYIHNGVFCYGKKEDRSLNESESDSIMMKIMSCDIESGDERELVTPLELYSEADQYMADELNCGIFYTDQENIYISVFYDGPGHPGTYCALYEINLNTGVKTEIEGPDGFHGFILDVTKEGDYLYLVREDLYVRVALVAYHIPTKEEYELGQFYIGQDEQYMYVYDDAEYLRPYYHPNYDGDRRGIKEPEELFKDSRKISRIPIGSVKREPAQLDDFKKYLDYDQGDWNSFYHQYMNPIIKEGYTSKPSTKGQYGLYQENSESPFYETKDDISGFEKVTITSIEKLNIQLKQEALTLDSGSSQKLDWALDQEGATLYFTSSNPSVATIDKEGLIRAHSPGSANISMTAIKDGSKRDVKNVHLIVEGSPKVFLAVKPTIIIGKPGEKVKIQYRAANGSTLEVASENKELQMEQTSDHYIEVTVPQEGHSEIVFTANKDGYSENKAVIPITRGSDDFKQTITYLTGPWEAISDYEKNLENTRDTIASQADIIASELGAVIRSPKKNLYTITKNDCTALLDRTWNIKQILKQHMNEAEIIPDRDFANTLKINLEKVKDKTTIVISKKELDKVNEELKPLEFNIKELGVSIGLPLQHWKDLLKDQDTLLIHVEKEEEGISLSYEDGDGDKISKLSHNLDITLHDHLLKKPQETGIVIQNGNSKLDIGGHYNEAEKGVTAGVAKAGHIYPVENSVNYSDISSQDSEIKEAITSLGKMGVVDSEGEKNKDHFRPDDIITRAEFSSMIVRAFYLLDDNLETSFSDVDKSAWYYNYVASSEAHNIVAGYPEGTFKPDDAISKEQMLGISGRWLRNEKGYQPVSSVSSYVNHFKDRQDISQWAVEDVALSLREQIISVSTDNELKPREGVKRSEAALILNKMLDKLYR